MLARVMGLATAINPQRATRSGRRAEGTVDMEHIEDTTFITRAHFTASLMFVLALAGCGGSAPSPDEPGASEGDTTSSSGGEAPGPTGVVNKSGSSSVAARIGSAGGSLTLSSGPKVEIPPGTIEGSEEVVLKEAQNTTAFFNQESERPVGPTFTVSPDLQAPEGSTIKVSIPLAAYPEGYGDVAIAYEYLVGNRVGAEDSEHTKWQYESARLTGGRAVAELPAVNGYRLQFVLSNLEAQ
jgi:hypothetical protein